MCRVETFASDEATAEDSRRAFAGISLAQIDWEEFKGVPGHELGASGSLRILAWNVARKWLFDFIAP
jgi:hypothetical protein